MKRLILSVLLSVIMLVGCETIVTADSLTYYYQSAYTNHHVIVKDLRANKDIFTDEEKKFLRTIQGNLQRTLSEANTGSVSVDRAIPILTHYHTIKGQYKAAISLVEAKLDQFPVEARMRIAQQIHDVTEFDRLVMKSLKDNGKVDPNTLVSLLSLMSRLAIAIL